MCAFFGLARKWYISRVFLQRHIWIVNYYVKSTTALQALHIASTAALPALQLCQNGIYDYGSFGSYSRMAGMAGMVAKTAKAACQVWQHDSMKLGQHGNYASLAAMPARQLCQLGSYASTAAMSAQQLCYYGCFSRYMIDWQQWQQMTIRQQKTWSYELQMHWLRS